MMAKKDGFIEPVLFGDKKEIIRILSGLDIVADEIEIFDVPDPLEAAAKAVELVRAGKAEILMKGKLNTSEILRAVLNKQTGLPHSGLLTCVAFTEIPGYHKMVVMNDCAIVPYPTLEQKIQQIEIVTDIMHKMGYGNDIKVGIMCANEGVNPKIIESADAAEIKQMNQDGRINGCIVEGPISLDIALKKDVAAQKGFDSPVAGDVDYMLFPSLAAGNLCSKALELYGAMPIAMVVGASVPIVVTSRATTKMVKYYSLVLAAAATGGNET